MFIENANILLKEYANIITTLYYLFMVLISTFTLIIAITKLFPKLRCFCYSSLVENQYGISFIFLNVRSQIIVLHKIIFLYEDQDDQKKLKKRIEKEFKEKTIISSTKITQFFPINDIKFGNLIYKVYVQDIEGRKYPVKIIGAK